MAIMEFELYDLRPRPKYRRRYKAVKACIHYRIHHYSDDEGKNHMTQYCNISPITKDNGDPYSCATLRKKLRCPRQVKK